MWCGKKTRVTFAGRGASFVAVLDHSSNASGFTVRSFMTNGSNMRSMWVQGRLGVGTKCFQASEYSAATRVSGFWAGLS